VSDDPRVGSELAGYRIVSLLGWGGMSVDARLGKNTRDAHEPTTLTVRQSA